MNKILTCALSGVVMLVSAGVHAAENAKNLDGTAGKEVRLSLEANPTTGYSWMLESLPSELIFVSSRYQQSKECKEGMVGCGGEQTFYFIGKASGKGTLKLIYGQPFDKSTWEEHKVNVEIK
ncbi:protease inhibitor I42 family protein [Pectobacterium carotovorum]|uniref:protease inhibitor I42 family protein n=1 Tax=Pectobacterium carotovorum TaxID=554 RepID=UPI0029D8FCDB|nr:protease inhibitor I42 family protein [Pectobacterium carotovorum]MDX6916137.1 protease inhibitor I42 family protein [Pectobacterium carotovorum]